jgi:hypothetical protein
MTQNQVIEIPYKPNAKQYRFHGLKAKYRGFCGGWGNGKTSGGCAEFFTRLCEYPGTNAIIARKTRPELKATTWEMFLHGDTQPTGWRGVPKDLIKTNNRSELYMELWNGSKIHGLPLDDPKKIENYNLGLFMIDQAEETEEDIFLKFHGRLRQVNAPREGIMLFNPNGHNWLWRRFIDPERRPSWKAVYRCVEATPFDNPNLPEDYLEQFEGLPEHWYQRFVLGSHEVFVGQIFTDFDPEVHFIQPFRIPSDWERWRCIDPGIRHEACVSWIARDYEGTCYYYREVLAPNQPVEWWAATIAEMEDRDDVGGPGEEIYRDLIGPEARQRSQTDGRSVYELFADFGITPEFSDKDPVARISRITEYLRPRPPIVPIDSPYLRPHNNGHSPGQPAHTVEVPRLYFFDNCTVYPEGPSPHDSEYECKIREYLPQYRWRPQRTNFTEEEPAEKPRKKDDHNIDCLGHILVAMDDLPLSPDQSAPRETPEQAFVREHFDEAIEEANDRSPVLPWHPGRVLVPS